MYYLDMGWEDLMLALEYDGEQHRDDVESIANDIERAEDIASVGWTTFGSSKEHRPAELSTEFAEPGTGDRVETALRPLEIA